MAGRHFDPCLSPSLIVDFDSVVIPNLEGSYVRFPLLGALLHSVFASRVGCRMWRWGGRERRHGRGWRNRRRFDSRHNYVSGYRADRSGGQDRLGDFHASAAQLRGTDPLSSKRDDDVCGGIRLPADFCDVQRHPDRAHESVFEASILDGPAFTETCGDALPPPQMGTLTGSVDASAIPTASYFTVNAQSGTSGASYSSASPAADFTLSAPAGSDRVEVLALSPASQGPTGSFSLVAAKTFNNQLVPGALNGGSPVVLGPADETTQAAITYVNAPSGFAAPSTIAIYEMTGGGGFLIASAATNQYPVLPAGAVQNGDSYSFVATARNSFQAVTSSVTGGPGGPVSFTFPAPWSYTGPMPAALPTLDFSYMGFAGQSGVRESASIGWQVGAFSENFITVTTTANYQNGSTTISIPDLSGLAGFLANAPSGAQAVWAAQITQNSGGTPAVASGVQNGGTYVVP
jgi:hypothetical protein